MVNNKNKAKIVDLDRLLYAISDATRRSMIDDLIKGERTVGELGEPFKMSAPAITKHIHVLHETGLIQVKKQGRQRICSLDPENLMRVETWLNKYHRFWSKKLEELEKSIKDIKRTEG